MKKNIIFVIIIILVCALTATVTYIVVDNKNSKDDVKENNNDKDPAKTDDLITLSESELKELVNSVPKVDYYDDYAKFNVYRKPSDINKMTETNMINEALTRLTLDIDVPSENTYQIPNFERTFEYRYSLSEVKKLISEMYNKNDITPQEFNLSELNGTYIGSQVLFEYYDNYFYGWLACAECGDNHISYIDTYEAKEDEIIIYEYSAELIENLGCENADQIKDYQTSASAEIEKELNDKFVCVTEYEKNNQTIEEYFKTIKNKFTKYKHTFKKGSNGYYWYQTDVQ